MMGLIYLAWHGSRSNWISLFARARPSVCVRCACRYNNAITVRCLVMMLVAGVLSMATT